MEEQNKSLAVIVPSVFKSIDFASLNSAIEQMATNSKRLDAEEKKMAIDIIGKWQGNVVKRLHEKANDMRNFVAFFDQKSANDYNYNYGYNTGYYNRTSNNFVDEDMQDSLAKQTSTVGAYEDYTAALTELRKHNQERPVRPVQQTKLTMEENFKNQKDYELAEHMYNLKSNQLNAKVAAAEKKWKGLLLENEMVQDALKKARSYCRNLNKLIDSCEDKTQAAQLNISIADSVTRDALKELLAFTDTI